MNVKTDTKEKFSVLTPETGAFTANMTAELEELPSRAATSPPHLVLNLTNVTTIDDGAAEKIALLQQGAYEKDHSFVICCMQPAVEAVFEKLELLDLMNVTPTESEAWDIIQMEEIERELLSDDGESGDDI